MDSSTTVRQEEKYQTSFEAVSAWVRMNRHWPNQKRGLKSTSAEQSHAMWLTNQRRFKRNGDLSPARTGQLEALGEETGVPMSWDPHEDEVPGRLHIPGGVGAGEHALAETKRAEW